jgi:2-iminoacetate synthase
MVSKAISRFESLIRPCHEEALEAMALESRRLTLQNFGKTIRLFAPLYLSNECINICKYCGFSRDNPILRTTLTPGQVEKEASHLFSQGFRNILLVAGEHPKFVNSHYLEECVSRLKKQGLPSIHLEVGPMETSEYQPLVRAGAEGLVVYQETYNRDIYSEMHTAGPKKDFDWRMACPERAYDAGFRRIGVGILLGLGDWRQEALALAVHVEHLLKRCWKASLTISLPRLRPAAGEFEPRVPVSDRELAQLLFAFRITFPQVGLVLSTRESPQLRDHLVLLGVTMMSAGSHTEPGGYTGVGQDDLHLTIKGKREALTPDVIPSEGEFATEQFSIADDRPVDTVANRIRELGYEPVWKDWDSEILSAKES